jgi:enoyl-CoA hydratase/carnithine racemase
MSTVTEAIEIVATDRVLRVRLANPPGNRLTPAIVARLDEALDRFEDDAFDALLFTGMGKVFSKGFDIRAGDTPPAPPELRRNLLWSNAVFSRISRSPKPTIAAINGSCLGGGLELSLAFHFRLCVENARLGLPEIWMNLTPGLGGFYRLARLVGTAKTLELAALGTLITAHEALQLGIVNRLYPQDTFADGADAFVKSLLGADQRAIRELIRLAACCAPGVEEHNIRQGAESFAKLTHLVSRTSP